MAQPSPATCATVWAADHSRITVTLLCGALYVIGLQITVSVSKLIGLYHLPAYPDLDEHPHRHRALCRGWRHARRASPFQKWLLACLFLIGAVVASMLAGRFRSQALADADNELQYSMQDLWKGLGLLLVASLLMPAYTLGASYGLQSITQPNGLAVLPFMALLATGRFHRLHTLQRLVAHHPQAMAPRHAVPVSNCTNFGILAGLAHYGGNIIHTFSTASLSTVIAWPLGMTAGLWTQLWGLVYGEFKGAPRKSYIALGAAVVCYFIGAYIVTLMT
jgi:hypothetical protein